MPERYMTDTEDIFENCPIQSDLSTLEKRVEMFLNYANTGDQETLNLDNITNTDVRRYTKDFIENTIPNLISYYCLTIKDIKQREQLCNYLSVTLCDNYTNENIQAHFIEVGDFTLAMYAIQTGIKGVTLRLEPLNDSPEFLQEIWNETYEEERPRSKVQQLEGVEKRRVFSELKKDFGL